MSAAARAVRASAPRAAAAPGPMRDPGPRPARRGPVAERIRELRRGARWTQKQLAERAGFSLALVRVVEQGRVPPSAEFVRAVARLFELRPRDVDPDAVPEIVRPPAPRHDDAVILLADLLAVLPAAVEQLGGVHVEGRDGRCVGCGDRRWPCVTAWAVARAEWLRRSGV